MGRLQAVAALLLVLGGCVETDVTFCSDGRVCPPGLACAPAGGYCTPPANIAACADRDEGDSCSLVNGDIGRCSLGGCIDTSCGDGFNDETEVCDDGNVTSGDGCRSDCQKVEICGDAIPDEGELCDDGNQNAADGCDQCVTTGWQATTLLRGGISATSEQLDLPFDLAVDALGNVFIADTDNQRIRRVDGTSGIITTIAGSGIRGFAGDGGPAAIAELDDPKGIAVDGQGNIFIADFGNRRIRRIDGTTGFITTVAGGGSGGDGGPATSASLAARSVFVDGLGNLFVASGSRIRRIDGTSGIITTPVTGLADATDVVVDSQGNLFITETLSSRIRRVDAVTGELTFILFPGVPSLSRPEGVAVDSQGNIFVASTINDRIWRRDAITGVHVTVVGSGFRGFGGDGGLATDALLNRPTAVAVDSVGNLFIADRYNDRIRRVDGLTGIITTLAGSSTAIGDQAQATTVSFDDPHGVAVDGDGNVFVVDNNHHVIYRVDGITGVATAVAGSAGNFGYDFDEPRPAVGALLKRPTGLAVDGQGNLFIADRNNHRIRRVDAVSGLITTVAGDGGTTFGGDDGPATEAQLLSPEAVAFDTLGNMFIADAGHHRIRRVDVQTGIITTVAGDGTRGFIDDTPRPATRAWLDTPQGVAVDALGNVFIADTQNDRLRVVDAVSGDISTLASIFDPLSVSDDGQGNVLLVVDKELLRVDKLTGIMTTVLATGCCGDGGSATNAGVTRSEDVTVDGFGNVFITTNFRARRIDASSGIITTVFGAIDPLGVGTVDAATLADPRAMCVANDLTLFAGGSTGTVQAIRGGILEVVAGRYADGTATGNLARFQSSSFGDVGGVVLDAAAGVIYLSETSENRLHIVTVVDADDPSTWTIAPLAGALAPGYADGDALTARFRQPAGLYFDDTSRVLYVADRGNHVLRTIDVDSGFVATVAGTPQVLGFGGDGGPADQARLFLPEAVTACSNGDLFVADAGNNRIRRIDTTTGFISTVLGDGVAASSGEGSPSILFPVNRPAGLACDAFGNLFVTSTQTVRMLAADDDGVIDGTGAVQSIYGLDRTKPPASLTQCLTGIAVLDDTTIHVTDSCTGFLIELVRQPL